MASINENLSPPSHMDSTDGSIALSAKRKRAGSNTDRDPNDSSASETPQPTAASIEETQSSVKDLVDVLKVHDTVPSILNRPLTDRESSSEPQAKRHKAEDTFETQSTIITRAASKSYKDLDDVLRDVDSAVSDVLEKLELPNGASRNQYIPSEGPQSEIAFKVTAFKKRAHKFVENETALQKDGGSSKLSAINNSRFAANGHLGVNATKINAGLGDNKTVLTLYGNAPGPRQLFSSFQMSGQVDGEENGIQPLREVGLPTGISTTHIIPIKSSSFVPESKQATLGEVFPTPSTIPALQPPKPSKNSTTRSSTVGWYQPAGGDLHAKNGSYFKAPISCGQWLDYSQLTSPQIPKKRQRDRAMSLVGAKAPLPEPESAESAAAKLDALFRSAYSSFAPTKDDSAAVAPTGMLERVWWQQSGERSFNRLVENANSLDAATAPELDVKDEVNDANDEMKSFEELVENWNEDVIDPALAPADASVEKSTEEKDAEEVLEGISELLETLNSYQRIRNMSLNPTTRPAGLLTTPDSSSLKTPSKPSEAEQATYEILKSQLSLMISTLPPFAVAKLDPDRLADLRISTKIEIQTDDYRGVMEEGDTVAKARTAAAMGTTSSGRSVPPSVHRTSSSLYGNQYSSSRPTVSAAQQYYGAQTPARPSPNMQRPPSASSVPYPAQRPASATPYRPNAYGTPTYGHQATRAVQQQYQPSSTGQYLQTPSAQSYMRTSQGYPGVSQGTPQASINGRYGSQPSYPQQAQNGHDYRYGAASNIARQSSPQKPLYSPQPNAAQPRSSYSTATPGMPQDRRPYASNPMMNGATQQTNQGQYTPLPTTSLTNYSTFMTQEQQSSMMERQRAQLAAQQQSAQQQARNAAQAALGSPSKTSVNGNSAVAAGL